MIVYQKVSELFRGGVTCNLSILSSYQKKNKWGSDNNMFIYVGHLLPIIYIVLPIL